MKDFGRTSAPTVGPGRKSTGAQLRLQLTNALTACKRLMIHFVNNKRTRNCPKNDQTSFLHVFPIKEAANLPLSTILDSLFFACIKEKHPKETSV